MPLDETSAFATWPEIDRRLLSDGSASLPAFPLEVLPPRWRRWVERSAQSFTPVDYVAQALLGTVSTACGAGVVVKITPQWSEPLLLWLALVGGPSSGKSPALATVARLHAAFLPVNDDERHSALPPPEVTDDTRLHPLVWAAERSLRGVTLLREDLGDWIVEARRGSDRTGWLAGWNGKAAAATRAHHFDADAERFPLTVLGGLSADRLGETLRGRDTGFAARLLFAWPGPALNPVFADEAADDEGIRALLRRISELARPAAEPGWFDLKPAAMERLQELLPRLDRLRRDAEGSEAAWIGKGAGTILRLAGLLALLDWAEDGTADLPDNIDAPVLDRAHALWSDFFLPHARRVFGETGDTGHDRLVRRAARWLKRSRFTTVSREDIRRIALSQAVNAEGADLVIERLELAGIVRPVACEAQGRRGPLRRRWEVSPALR